MSFDVINRSSTFQQYVNDTLHNFLDMFVTVYIDNILIYSSKMSEHQKHVRMILEQLRDADLQCNISKCKFHASEVTYLDLIISHDGIKMNSVKVEAVVNWKDP